MRISRGGRGQGVWAPTPPGKSQIYRVPKQYWSGSLGKSQSYPAIIPYWVIIGPSVKRHLDDDPLLVVCESSHHS